MYKLFPENTCKDNASREQNHKVYFNDYAKAQLILCKDRINKFKLSLYFSIKILYFLILLFNVDLQRITLQNL